MLGHTHSKHPGFLGERGLSGVSIRISHGFAFAASYCSIRQCPPTRLAGMAARAQPLRQSCNEFSGTQRLALHRFRIAGEAAGYLGTPHAFRMALRYQDLTVRFAIAVQPGSRAGSEGATASPISDRT